jgi:chlorophyll synthase
VSGEQQAVFLINTFLILLTLLEQFQYFLKDPVKYDVKYQASAQPFFVLGLLVTALATSH